MLLIDNSKTAIMVPSIYENQNLSEQWIGLLIESQGIEMFVLHIHINSNACIQIIA